MKVQYAFSMIELVFVIVVMGILTSLAIPRLDRDLRQEAMDSIVSDIMLTQRMAVSDFRHDLNNSLWQKSYWQWRVTNCRASDKVFYVVGANRDYRTNIDQSESAIDPYNQKYLYQPNTYCGESARMSDANSPRTDIYTKFGISSVEFEGGCNGQHHVAFDEFGRPHSGIYGYTQPNFEFLLKEDCTVTFNFDNGLIDNKNPFTITIEAISGRTYISNQ